MPGRRCWPTVAGHFRRPPRLQSCVVGILIGTWIVCGGSIESWVLTARAQAPTARLAAEEFSYLPELADTPSNPDDAIQPPAPIVERLPEIRPLEVVDDAMVEGLRLPTIAGSRDVSDDESTLETSDDETVIFDEFWYRGAGHHRTGGWLIGKGDSMGIFSLGSESEYDFTKHNHDLVFDWAIHWVMGPRQTDMPARLYDFLVRWGHRSNLTDRFGYDLSFSLGFYSDFEGSARQGLRWPSTAVMYYRATERLQWLLGIDILDRDDYFCLPVAGAVWTPRSDLRFDFVFPRPRVAFQSPRLGWLYVGGEMGGGTWAIERATGIDDVVTYRDFRAVMGFHSHTERRISWFSQLGVSFSRHLEFRSGLGDFTPQSVVLLNVTAMY